MDVDGLYIGDCFFVVNADTAVTEGVYTDPEEISKYHPHLDNFEVIPSVVLCKPCGCILDFEDVEFIDEN